LVQSPGFVAAKLKFTFVLSGWNESSSSAILSAALGYHGENRVIGREYFARQAAILFGLAKATKDPKISAALLEKAADIKLKVDAAGTRPDLTPLAPDIEPPTAT
jgi:hypothetical protein